MNYNFIKTPSDKHKKILELITQNAINIRGQIINYTIILERIMDDIISHHFCKNKDRANEIQEILLSTDRITFESKRAVLSLIVKKHYIKFDEKYKSCINEIQDVGKLRNDIAHSLLNTKIEYLEKSKGKEVHFIRFKNSKEEIVFNSDILDDKLNFIINHINKIMILHRYVKLITKISKPN